MACDNTKRILVIKNISSNFIEEAILILKSSPDRCSLKNRGGFVSKKENKTNIHILREAEEVINNYIKINGAQGELGTKISLRPHKTRLELFSSTATILAFLGFIALLTFAAIKFFG
ncbi:MAG: hypothetical protein GX992_01065 [Clostridium sp.]|nr:hypothetical protein [Clostridium sp.]